MGTSHERLKVHRRSLSLHGLRYSVLSPRPIEQARFATVRLHDLWHVLTDVEGAHLLARLCWAMAYQRHERTVMVVDPQLLVPNPFDADPSSSMVIVNSDLGSFSRGAVADLKAQLPFAMPSSGTVVLQTRGLDLALGDPVTFAEREGQTAGSMEHRTRRWIDGVNGLLVLAAPPPVLRMWGVELSDHGRSSPTGTCWSYLDDPEKEGEVHVLDDFIDQVGHSIALRNLLFPDRTRQALADDERRQMWAIGQNRQH
jgi:hypothetical protein